ncbi:MAG: hypothetical protein V1914_01910 [archaeon]
MEKQKILGLSNRGEIGICYILEKKSSFYEFLLSLLKELKVEQVPDLYDGTDLPDAKKEVDTYFYWDDPNVSVTSIVATNKIFLIIRTEQKDKLHEFMEKNTEFVKTE